MPRSLSVYLDLLRFCAAALVLFYHASYTEISGGVLHRFGYLANDAVMVFFVLSGFVIAYVADSSQSNGADFMKARFARLLSVTIPALVLTVVVDTVGLHTDPSLYPAANFQDSYPVGRFLACAAFLNQLWSLDIRPFSNGPYWSIGYEFWYYMIFAAAVFLRSYRRWIAVALMALIAGPKILILLPLWLLGVAVYRIARKGATSPMTGVPLIVVSLVGYVALWSFKRRIATDDAVDAMIPFHLAWSTQLFSKYVVGVLAALNILGFSMLAGSVEFRRFGAPIRTLAGATFSIYLFHYPLLRMWAAVLPSFEVHLRTLTIVALTIGIIALLAPVTEGRKNTVRRWIDAISSRRRSGPNEAAPPALPTS